MFYVAKTTWLNKNTGTFEFNQRSTCSTKLEVAKVLSSREEIFTEMLFEINQKESEINLFVIYI